jgi:hypothetical protein
VKLPYPQSIPCTFDNFPIALDIRLGSLAPSEVEGASLGSKFTLTRTPKCGMAQGDYIIGEALPECRMIYSDTGSDDHFNFKVSFIGYGTFYKLTSHDEYLRFQVYKAIAIETPLLSEKVFGDTFYCETLIPSNTDATTLFNYNSLTFQYIEQVSAGSKNGTVIINEGGVAQEFTLSEGASLTVTSEIGVTTTYTFIGGTMVVS